MILPRSFTQLNLSSPSKPEMAQTFQHILPQSFLQELACVIPQSVWPPFYHLPSEMKIHMSSPPPKYSLSNYTPQEAGETAQWLRAPTALVQGLSLFPKSNPGVSQLPVPLAPRGSLAPVGPYTHMNTHTNTHTYVNISKSNKSF